MTPADCALIILAHNGAPFTHHCLESILGAAVLPAEVFLVDNASSDETPALIAEMAPRYRAAGIEFTTWRNAENKGCSLARNEAWQRVRSAYTVLLDNDAVVCTRTWLTDLAAVFQAHPQTGIVGPKLIYPYAPHPIQCAGVSISRLGRIAFRGRGSPRHDPRYSTHWATWSLISACWMMRTDLRERVGLLDECFHPVQYEDLDLCIRARQAGFAVAYTPTVEMYHFEGITTAAIGQKEYRRNIARNSLTFRARYHELFRTFTEELPSPEYRWRQRDELGLTADLDLRYSD
jgi:GT2 family glycosyltransferase